MPILFDPFEEVENSSKLGFDDKTFFKELYFFSEEGKSVLLSSTSSLSAIKQFQLCCQQKSRKMSPPIHSKMSVCSADTSIEWTRTPELTALITWNLSINEKYALPYSQQKLVSPKWSCTLTFWQIHAIRLKTSAANEIYEYSWMSKKKNLFNGKRIYFFVLIDPARNPR